MKKSVLELTEQDVIHAETEEQAIALCKLFDSLGLTWITGESYLKGTHWHYGKKNTCYNPVKGGYTNLISSKKNDSIIHKATDFISVQEVENKEISTPEYYDNSKGSLYKVANERNWNAYIFDVVKRLERGEKKDPLKKEIEKSIAVLQIWLNEI